MVEIGTDLPIEFALPDGIAEGDQLPWRVRLAPRDPAGGCNPDDAYGGPATSDGAATGGEVEDYVIDNIPTAIGLLTFEGRLSSGSSIFFLLSTIILLIGGSLIYLQWRKGKAVLK